MAEKDLSLTILFDIYGGLLSENERNAFEYYYCDDLSLSEISELMKMTRQGVRDNIVRAEKLLRDKDYLTAMGGGITFSGGEPTGQPEFLLEVLDRTAAMHRAIETSAYCSSKVFSAVLARVDYVMMDLKLMDPERHRHYTGVPNEPILENLERLKKSGKPFRIRIPVIPGVNDSDENFEQTALRLTDAPALEQVELLPYHVTAGAKYAMVGRQYRPEFDTAAAPNLNTGIFLAHGIACTHL